MIRIAASTAILAFRKRFLGGLVRRGSEGDVASAAGKGAGLADLFGVLKTNSPH